MRYLRQFTTFFLAACSLGAGTQAYIGLCCNQPSTISKISGSKVQTFTAGAGADAIVLSPDGTRAYVAVAGAYGGSGVPQSIAVLNTSDGSAVGTIPLPTGRLGIQLLISPDGSHLYAEADAGLLFIDVKNMAVTTTVPVFTSNNIAISPDGAQIFMPSRNSAGITVVDTATAQASSMSFFGASPGAIAVAPNGKNLVVADPNVDNLDILDRATGALISTIHLNTYNGMRNFVLSPDGTRGYVNVNGSGYPSLLVAVDLVGLSVLYQAPSPLLGAISISPDGSKLLGAGINLPVAFEGMPGRS